MQQATLTKTNMDNEAYRDYEQGEIVAEREDERYLAEYDEYDDPEYPLSNAVANALVGLFGLLVLLGIYQAGQVISCLWRYCG